MRKAIDRSFVARLLLSLALMSACAFAVRAETVIGDDGAPGADCDLVADPSCVGGTGGDGESVTALGNAAVAIGGNGGATGIGVYGNGGSGGSATALANGSSAIGAVIVSASAIAGAGGDGYADSDHFLFGRGGTEDRH